MSEGTETGKGPEKRRGVRVRTSDLFPEPARDYTNTRTKHSPSIASPLRRKGSSPSRWSRPPPNFPDSQQNRPKHAGENAIETPFLDSESSY
ncbi:hypothetical protein E2C01_024075 [Portunus trituberculatus]|uniref:Uncharacterized protein n=1 Tax=Portunus trituberculatus TaxID=210409 RepID=A0A5B7EC76_PORTR|nr:hypothetical protein [Portunus trituberculatus]